MKRGTMTDQGKVFDVVHVFGKQWVNADELVNISADLRDAQDKLAKVRSYLEKTVTPTASVAALTQILGDDK